jgi:hypothetical protein
MIQVCELFQGQGVRIGRCMNHQRLHRANSCIRDPSKRTAITDKTIG